MPPYQDTAAQQYAIVTTIINYQPAVCALLRGNKRQSPDEQDI